MTSGRASLRVLRKVVQDSTERTMEAHVRRVEKQQSRRKVREVTQATTEEVARRDVPMFDMGRGQPAPELINSTKVEDWFREALHRLYGDKLELPQRGQWWEGKEYKNVKRLLKKHGPERLKRAIFYLCETWPERLEKADGFLGGTPSINYLQANGARIFSEMDGVTPIRDFRKTSSKRSKVTGAKKGKDVDEYRPPEKPIGVGWYV